MSILMKLVSAASKQRIFKWVFYNKDNSNRRCPICLSRKFTYEYSDFIEHTPSEANIKCEKCHNYIGFWGYGTYKPPFQSKEK